MKHFTLYFTLLLIPLLGACRGGEEHLFPLSPSERSQHNEESLRQLLCSRPNGWHLRYFPKVDKGLNSDITENIKKFRESLLSYNLQSKTGVGGYNLFVAFQPDGSAKILSDIPSATTDKESYYTPSYTPETRVAQYEIRTADGLNLFFSTSTPIDHLYWLDTNASNRYILHEIKGDTIVLRTARYHTLDRELVELTPLSTPLEKWEEDMAKIVQQAETFRLRSYESGSTSTKESRTCRLDIRLTSTGKSLYQTSIDYGQMLMSDRQSASYSKDIVTDRRVAQYDRTRYELFIRNEQPHLTIEGYDNSQYYTALGSGYIPTREGVYFFPGLKFNDQTLFQEFKYKGDKVWESQVGPYTALILFMDNKQKA